MAYNDSPYYTGNTGMVGYKPTTNYSSLKGFDPYRNMSTNTGLSTGFKKASAFRPDGTNKTTVTNSPASNQFTGLSNMSLADNAKAVYGNYFNPEGMSGVTYTGDYGAPVELTYAQLDAIQNPTQGSEGINTSNGLSTMGNIAQGAQALSGLFNSYLGYRNYKLAKDMFGFEKAATNRNFANQASEYNTGLQNAGEVGMALAGNTMDANARAARQAQLDSQKISTAPIG